ncbi:hypothetical protein [Pseudanabaena sp. UWO310]|uniref:hypothetical protein n=1 Tax=Pseudanabaena sp. UWO310 TaxID=2480795 RepID=UPI00115858CC|nr:hypothetical protein [Pseudanabaena sp. UWO310]TYQ31610.1 hypothetical protein PseudUWO310_02585 [Pseudanabaena sp. UWO310]
MANISGAWLGTYWQWGLPTRFEVEFIQSGNSLTGNILDDGSLGEAIVNGEVIGRSVSFTKKYYSHNYIINYFGTINQEENLISGEWKIDAFIGDSGAWELKRNYSDLNKELSDNLQSQIPFLTYVS